MVRKNLFVRHLALTPAFIDQLAELRKVTWLEGCLQLQYVDSTAVMPLVLIESFAHVGGLSCRECKFDNSGSLDNTFLNQSSEVGALDDTLTIDQVGQCLTGVCIGKRFD